MKLFWEEILIFTKKAMQHTFQINAGELDASFVKSVRALYGKKKIKIVIEEVEEVPNQPNQRELFRKSEEIRLSLKDFKVDPNLDFSKLADEVNL